MGSKRASKAKRIILIIVSSILCVVVCGLLAQRIVYGRFYRISDSLQRIPGLSDGFVPQGVTRLENSDVWLVCGYLDGDGASRIYRLDGKGNNSVIYLQKEDGSTYQGHAGGLTAAGDYVYVSNASKLFVLKVEDVVNAPDGGTLAFIGHFDVPCRASYCSSDGNMVYVGEYHAPGYDTDEGHAVETSDGHVHQAMTFGYRLSEDGRYGIADTENPSIAFSTCDKVQGFAASDGRVVLSTSAGMANSKLRIYSSEGRDGFFGQTPLLVLDGSRELDVVTMPHMSEDLDFRDGLLYMGFEAGARKFGFGLIPFSMKSVYALDLGRL